MKVLNMRLNMRGAVSVPWFPHTGHRVVGSPGVPLMRGSSARNRFLHCLQSTRGSTNPARCPDASHTLRSEEHTSELQSRLHLVCRLLLEKNKMNKDSQSLSCAS